jgi:hypothetical protein
MAKARPLSAKQLAVIDDLFKDEPAESQILEKHGISRRLYDRWLADESFRRHLETRKAWECRRNEIILVRSAREAVTNLMALTKSEQAETARKACLDIITMSADLSAGPDTKPGENPTPASESLNLTPERAGKILTFLAEEEQVGTS